MRKIITIFLSAVLAVSLLAGCGSSKSDSESTAATQAPEMTTANVSGNENADYSADEDKGSVEEQLAEVSTKCKPGEYYGDLLKLGGAYGSQTWLPFQIGGRFGVKIYIFEYLLGADGEGKTHLLLLKSIDEKDELTYECELWDFIHDTAGNDITANDVKYSFEQFVAEGNQGSIASIDNIEVTGDYTFNINLNAPFAIGDLDAQIGAVPIVSQAAYEADPAHMADNPIGTGPYKLKEWAASAYAVWEANEDYWFLNVDDEEWLAENDYVWTYQNWKEIRVDAITDASARAVALESGEVDACTKMDDADVQAYASDPSSGITTFNIPNIPSIMWYFNCNEVSPCSDVNLRKAICYGLDNAAIASGLNVPAYPAYGLQPALFDAPESWATGEGRDYYNYNVEKAKECLAESNYNGEEIHIMLMNNQVYIDAMIMVQAQLAEIGINIQLDACELAVTNTNKYDWGTWDLFVNTFGGGTYLPNVLVNWTSSYAYDALQGLQVMGIYDDKLDELYAAVRDVHDDKSIEDWDAYYTDEMCYGYAVAEYYTQTACRSNILPALCTEKNEFCPGAFSKVEE